MTEEQRKAILLQAQVNEHMYALMREQGVVIEIEENIGIKFMHTERRSSEDYGMSFLSAAVTDNAMTENSLETSNDKEISRSINEILLSSTSLSDIDADSANSSLLM